MTISEIAKMAGVSSATVSRYLNNGYISDEKRDILDKIIRETGYIPSREAQMLRTKKTKLIGIVLPKIDSEAIGRIVYGISGVLYKNGYQILLADTFNNIDREIEYLKVFTNNSVDGIIFIATILTDEHIRLLNAMKIPIVIVGQRVEGFPCVYHDDFNAAIDITNVLIKSGRKNIGYIGVRCDDVAVGFERRRGYLEALGQNKYAVNASMQVCGFAIEDGYNACKNMLCEAQNINGIFCATDSIAVGAIQYLYDVNKSVPGDVAIVGIGHNKLSQVISPKLSTVHYHYKTSGERAALMILNGINNEPTPPDGVRLAYELVLQGSV